MRPAAKHNAATLPFLLLTHITPSSCSWPLVKSASKQCATVCNYWMCARAQAVVGTGHPRGPVGERIGDTPVGALIALVVLGISEWILVARIL